MVDLLSRERAHEGCGVDHQQGNAVAILFILKVMLKLKEDLYKNNYTQ